MGTGDDTVESYYHHVNAAEEVIENGEGVEELARAQVHATLAVAAAIRSLTDVVWGAGSS